MTAKDFLAAYEGDPSGFQVVEEGEVTKLEMIRGPGKNLERKEVRKMTGNEEKLQKSVSELQKFLSSGKKMDPIDLLHMLDRLRTNMTGVQTDRMVDEKTRKKKRGGKS